MKCCWFIHLAFRCRDWVKGLTKLGQVNHNRRKTFANRGLNLRDYCKSNAPLATEFPLPATSNGRKHLSPAYESANYVVLHLSQTQPEDKFSGATWVALCT